MWCAHGVKVLGELIGTVTHVVCSRCESIRGANRNSHTCGVLTV